MTGAPRPKLRVLLVEDNPLNIELERDLLEMKGHEVTVATDGASALRSFAHGKFDLVLLDLMLPVISGLDVCREIRATSDVPIIMVTAKGEEVDTVVGLEVGADDYVTKPYRLRELVARMRSILREAGWSDGPPATPEVTLGHDTEVELARKLVATGDVLLRMTEEYAPNHLCAHLYELSQAYNQFYEHCPVLRSEEPLRSSRLALCDATARTLQVGLALLGIGVLEKI